MHTTTLTRSIAALSVLIAASSLSACGPQSPGQPSSTSGTPSAEASPAPSYPSQRAEVTTAFPELARLEEIAQLHGGNRAATTAGGAATRQFIVDELTAAGYAPRIEEFDLAGGGRGANILAAIPGSGTEKLVVGAHYDSVTQGPGINDNGTGTATLLRIAKELKAEGLTPRHMIEFAFWDSEEEGIQGSAAYVDALDDAALNAVAGYLNIDMTGTFGGAYGILDGDNSTVADLPEEVREEAEKNLSLPQGSETIEQALQAIYQRLGATPLHQELLASGASDTAPFMKAGIPTGGLGMLSQDAEVNADGELLFAPCYHQACDTLDNVDLAAMTMNLTALTEAVRNLSA